MRFSIRALQVTGIGRRDARRRAGAVAGLATASSLVCAAAMTPASADPAVRPDPATTTGTTAATATATIGSAFGISAQGAVSVPATPVVSSAAARRTFGRLASMTAGPLLHTSALSVEARSRYARASVAGVDALRSTLSADALTAECTDGRGSVLLIGAKLAGRQLAAAPAPNTTIPVTLPRLGKAKVTLNRQVWQADRRLTVTGLSISVRLADDTPQTFEIASATCGRVAGVETPGQSSDPASPQGTASEGGPAAGSTAGSTGDASAGPAGGMDPAEAKDPAEVRDPAGSADGAEPGSTDADAASSPAESAGSGQVRRATAPTPVRSTLAVTG